MVQACVNVAAALGACVGPLAIGALTREDPVDGWRNYYVGVASVAIAALWPQLTVLFSGSRWPFGESQRHAF